MELRASWATDEIMALYREQRRQEQAEWMREVTVHEIDLDWNIISTTTYPTKWATQARAPHMRSILGAPGSVFYYQNRSKS